MRAGAHPEADRKAGTRGMTLIEVMIVIAIIGVMTVYLTDAYKQWSMKYKTENEIKELYAGLVDARARAMTRNRVHFVSLQAAPARFEIKEDTSPGPDGNGVYEAADRTVVQKAPINPLAWSLASGTARFSINGNGIAQDSGFIRLDTDVNADYDCISLSSTRINLGRFDEGTNTCRSR